MSGLLLKLRALGYPALDSLSSPPELLRSPSLSSAAIRTMIAWMEASKIRLLPVAERAGLQAVDDDKRWTAAFQSYLQQLECTRPYGDDMTPEQTAGVLDWLAAQAVAAEYSDHAGEFNALSKMWAIGRSAGGAADAAAATGGTAAAAGAGSAGLSSAAALSGATLDCSSDAEREPFEAELRSVAQLFALPYDPAQKAAMLRVIRRRVEECLVAEAEEQHGGAAGAALAQLSVSSSSGSAAAASAASSSSSPSSAAASSSAASSAAKSSSKRPVRRSHAPPPTPLPTTAAEALAALDELEKGFPSTGDVLVDRAGTVLRLLFLHDLRASQNLANELMGLAQEYTSDPKTDSKLGKVGQ